VKSEDTRVLLLIPLAVPESRLSFSPCPNSFITWDTGRQRCLCLKDGAKQDSPVGLSFLTFFPYTGPNEVPVPPPAAAAAAASSDTLPSPALAAFTASSASANVIYLGGVAGSACVLLVLKCAGIEGWDFVFGVKPN
jgi:hypothetical protein